MKPRSTTVPDGGSIRLPPRDIAGVVTAEAELGVIGRECLTLAEAAVDVVVAGYVLIAEVTTENSLQRNPRLLTRAQSFDSFLVFGPWITVAEPVDRIDGVRVQTRSESEVIAENTVKSV